MKDYDEMKEKLKQYNRIPDPHDTIGMQVILMNNLLLL